MANKRFTFADAKLKIKELEAQVEDLQGILREEFENAKDDIIEDVSSFGWGDAAIAVAPSEPTWFHSRPRLMIVVFSSSIAASDIAPSLPIQLPRNVMR